MTDAELAGGNLFTTLVHSGAPLMAGDVVKMPKFGAVQRQDGGFGCMYTLTHSSRSRGPLWAKLRLPM